MVIIQNVQSLTSIKPIDIMAEFLKVRPIRQGNLFCHFGGQPLTCFQFTSELNKALKTIDIDSVKYNSHCFWIGAATNAAKLGLSDDEICKAGRWKSNSYKSDIRF